jgi:hypothetical protein
VESSYEEEGNVIHECDTEAVWTFKCSGSHCESAFSEFELASKNDKEIFALKSRNLMNRSFTSVPIWKGKVRGKCPATMPALKKPGIDCKKEECDGFKVGGLHPCWVPAGLVSRADWEKTGGGDCNDCGHYDCPNEACFRIVEPTAQSNEENETWIGIGILLLALGLCCCGMGTSYAVCCVRLMKMTGSEKYWGDSSSDSRSHVDRSPGAASV